jgi:hypothetical protein
LFPSVVQTLSEVWASDGYKLLVLLVLSQQCSCRSLWDWLCFQVLLNIII